MRRFIILTTALAALMLSSGCASLSKYNPFPQHVFSSPSHSSKDSSTATRSAKTNPYTVMGRTYYPLKSAAGYDETGVASWYGKDFHGRKTANGQIYDMYGVSAAHKTLPLGTRVRVSNLENGREVTLVVNDRGPFVKGRLIDLSYGAARRLDIVDQGTAKVRIKAIGTAPSPTANMASRTVYHVRVGAYSNRDNAVRTHRELVRSGHKGARIATINSSGRTLHVVQAGSYSNKSRAERMLRQLRRQFPSSYISS
ncbi:septal ring lytic transglycosylase RlpA family protein [Salidesulfovibrio brasiliensis]